MVIFDVLKLAVRTMSFKLRKINSTTVEDYNAAAATYDDYYSRYLGRSASALSAELPLKAGMTVIDLACGTGFFSHKIAEIVGPEGRVLAVDLSPGMLARNRENALAKGLTNIDFVESDALDWLRHRIDSSASGIVCGWGICYMDHAALRQEIERVLRPGGFIGIIENRAHTLTAVSTLFRQVLIDHPNAIVKNMPINLPPGQKDLVRTFARGAIERVNSWDGEILVPCRTGAEVAEYMLRSGASAGFINALDRTRLDEIMTDFVRKADLHISKHGDLPVKHEYCALIGRKPDVLTLAA